MASFREKWIEAVDRKNSVLCAGLDPAEYAMGREEKGLPRNTNKERWALDYIEAVAPYCAAVKPNIQYWKKHRFERGDLRSLVKIREAAHSLGMVVIEDSKLADIGSTNDAGMFYAADKREDAVTFSPFAGNIKEAVEQADKRDIGLINMCLMSNSEYKREKMKLVPLTQEEVTEYSRLTQILIKHVDGVPHIPQYLQLASDSDRFGIDGIVIGAPSKKNHIGDHEIAMVRGCVGSDMLVLLPGVGAQGGEADAIWKHFAKDRVIVNVGRDLMLPKGSRSTPKDQAATAERYQYTLNRLRAA